MENKSQNNLEAKLPNVSEAHMIEQLNGNMTTAVLPVTVFIGVETFVGLIGNILILLIYTKRYERSNFRYFVLSMAVVDLTSCITTLPGEIFSQINWYDYQYDWICKVKSYFNVLTVWGSASNLLLLAFDRYRKICKPLCRQMQPSLALKLCVCFLAISAIVASPIAVLWGKQTYIYKFEGYNLRVSICEKSDSYADDIYPLIYIGCVYIFPVGLILFVVCSLNVITAVKLFGNRKPSFSGVNLGRSSDDSVVTLSTVCSEMENNNTNINTEHEERKMNVRMTENYSNTLNKDIPEPCPRTKSETTIETISEEIANKNNSQRLSIVTVREPALTEYANPEVTLESDIHVNFDIVHSGQISEDPRCQTQIGSLGSPVSGNQQSSRQTSTKQQQSLTMNESRRKQKTVIMLVLTSVFVTTMLLYVILITFVAGTEGVLKDLSNSEKVVFFFFWRLYFINTVVNPVLYGFLDPRFRGGLKSLLSGKGLSSKRYRFENMHFRRSCSSSFNFN